MNEKKMPNNIEAEQAVLGAMFLSKYALQSGIETINENVFYKEANQKIFLCLRELFEEKIPLDIMSVSNKLKNKKQLKLIGGIEYLSEVIDSVPSAANFSHYKKIIDESYLRRMIIEEGTKIVDNGFSLEESLSEVIDDAEKRIFNIGKNRETNEFKKIQDVLNVTHANLEKLAETEGEITGLATGFSYYDKITAGLQNNQLIIIASRPAMGKTALALNLATNVAINAGKTVAIFNLEMNAEQLSTRMLSSIGRIDSNKMSNGNFEHNDWKKLDEAILQLADTNIYIDDTPGISIGEIKAKARRLASSEEGLSLIVIDYLQLISGSAKYSGNRVQEVSEISRALKTLALELKIPIIALAQLSRDVEKREDKRPIMSDLRESGSIEQDADIVSFLYRDDYYNPENQASENISEAEWIIGKHRQGPTANIKLVFEKNVLTFSNKKIEN